MKGLNPSAFSFHVHSHKSTNRLALRVDEVEPLRLATTQIRNVMGHNPEAKSPAQIRHHFYQTVRLNNLVVDSKRALAL
jgi:hypothetical protein